jgi:hypothetical protein
MSIEMVFRGGETIEAKQTSKCDNALPTFAYIANLGELGKVCSGYK